MLSDKQWADEGAVWQHATLQPYLQALHSPLLTPPCSIDEPSSLHWHPGCGMWSVRAQGAVTACLMLFQPQQRRKALNWSITVLLKQRRNTHKASLTPTQTHTHTLTQCLKVEAVSSIQDLCTHGHKYQKCTIAFEHALKPNALGDMLASHQHNLPLWYSSKTWTTLKALKPALLQIAFNLIVVVQCYFRLWIVVTLKQKIRQVSHWHQTKNTRGKFGIQKLATALEQLLKVLKVSDQKSTDP